MERKQNIITSILNVVLEFLKYNLSIEDKRKSFFYIIHKKLLLELRCSLALNFNTCDIQSLQKRRKLFGLKFPLQWSKFQSVLHFIIRK